MAPSPQLKRSITLPSLALYGLGTIVGGGFYALLGQVAGVAGMYAPIAFFLTGLLAFVSALTFAELSSRFPVSAGEARYIHEGFGRRSLAIAAGWGVILTGVVSAATLAVATVGFLQDFVRVPAYLGIPIVVVGMGLIASWGIGESVRVVVAITIVEVGALLYVVGTSTASLAVLPERLPELLPPMTPDLWTGIFSGAFLGFYAFIGFEDMVNMAEEVTDVRRTLPIAIFVAVLAASVLYVCVSLVAVLAVPPSELALSNTPVAAIVNNQGWYAVTGLGIVSLLTGVNGALVQIIMASRVAYGMAARQQAPAWLGTINPRTRTPVLATAVMASAILILALFLPLATLARTTSSIILVVFATVNLALWRIKRRDPDENGDGPRLPLWMPLVGFGTCVLVLMFQSWLSLTS
jgi:amino acid transporter